MIKFPKNSIFVFVLQCDPKHNNNNKKAEKKKKKKEQEDSKGAEEQEEKRKKEKEEIHKFRYRKSKSKLTSKYINYDGVSERTSLFHPRNCNFRRCCFYFSLL